MSVLTNKGEYRDGRNVIGIVDPNPHTYLHWIGVTRSGGGPHSWLQQQSGLLVGGGAVDEGSSKRRSWNSCLCRATGKVGALNLL